MSASFAASRPVRAERASAFASAILAVAGFVIVTTEFLIVGLLPTIARDLSLSIATTGQFVTLFALTVMLFGPPLTAWLAHLERKRLFVAILLLFAAANALAAVATNVWVLAFARFVPALALPVFWGTASETAAELAGPARGGRAVATVYLGISAALLFGIPLGTLVAAPLGWRGSFWLLSGLCLAIAAMLAAALPTLRVPQRVRLAEQARILRDPFFVGNVLLSVLVFTAMFTSYTYLADMLEHLAHVAPNRVGWWLMGFGAVGLVGNALGGRWVASRPLAVTAAFCVALAAGVVATQAFAATWLGLLPALAVWGVANTALYPICQIRVMQSATHAQALAGTLNVSAANAGIALGAMAGGVVIAHGGLAHVGGVSAALAVAAALATIVVHRLRRGATA